MATNFLITGPTSAPATILLAHGAGAPMDSSSFSAATDAIANAGLRVARFEFSYMVARRETGGRRPPPRAEKLNPEYLAAVEDLSCEGPLLIGGKSMGGRVASMVADELSEAKRICGLLCLGYPFHPPAKPNQLRTKHMKSMKTPTLIVQGTRDPFGTSTEVPDYDLSTNIEIFWLNDGDHDLKPRKTISGFTVSDHLNAMAQKVAAWTAARL